MARLNLNKLKNPDECGVLILQVMQESYKLYLEGKYKDSVNQLSIIQGLILRSKHLVESQRRIDKNINKKKLLEEKKKSDNMNTSYIDKKKSTFKGLSDG